jgi:hypothetical protein
MNVMNQLFPFRAGLLLTTGFRKYQVLLAAAGLTMSAALLPAAAQSDACKSGYVWRLIAPDDHVCVLPYTRDRVALDNAAAAERRVPGEGNNCIAGYMWREANPDDKVCVVPQIRSETLRDNMMAQFRLASSPSAAPITPSVKTSDIPHPPLKAGCHNYDGTEWREVPCAPSPTINGHRLFPNPLSTPISMIMSNPTTIWNVIWGHLVDITFTEPFVWGSVDIEMPSNSTEASEVDSTYGNNAYSVQNNTNLFVCNALCANGKAFAALPGYPNSASGAGDIAEVQFVITSNVNSGQPDYLCLAQVDAIVLQDVARDPVDLSNPPPEGYGFIQQCVPLGNPFPLTGPGSVPDRTIGVTGYIACSPPDPNCSLVAIAPVAGTFPLQFRAVVAPDLLGLTGNWTQVSGTIYGLSNGSQAIFTKTQLTTMQMAASCVTWFLSPIPRACPRTSPRTSFKDDLSRYATAYQTYYDNTAETNNLSYGPPQFTCDGDYCLLWYISKSP